MHAQTHHCKEDKEKYRSVELYESTDICVEPEPSKVENGRNDLELVFIGLHKFNCMRVCASLEPLWLSCATEKKCGTDPQHHSL